MSQVDVAPLDTEALAEQLAVPVTSLHVLPGSVGAALGALAEPGGNSWRAAQAAGLTLAEIRDVIAAREDSGPPCEHVAALLDATHSAPQFISRLHRPCSVVSGVSAKRISTSAPATPSSAGSTRNKVAL